MISQRERGELARFYTVTDPKKHQKGYTVYKVTARIISRKNPEDVQEITVWKRYSDFRKLHRDLWQIHKNLCHQSELFPPFAKAKVFGRFDDTVIEERRQCSEDLLQFSANIPALYSSQHIEDFFKGGEVHDGSELIGPPEPLSDFLADSLSDCSSEVHKDIGGVDDLTAASQSEYGGLSSDSDLISLRVDTDSLADLDDGMASGGSSPNKQAGGRSPSPQVPREDGPSGPDLEAGRAGRAALFAGGLKPRAGKKDYLERASEQIKLAVQKEGEQDYQAAFSYYRSGVDLLLQGVQGEPSPTRREAVKKKTAEYLMRAEQISSQYLRDTLDTGPLQTVAPGPQGSRPSWSQRSPAEELKVFRVLGVIDKVLLVLDKRTQETFILKGLRKSSECGRNKKTIIPHCVPNMVRLHRYIVSEDSIFLVLQHAEGGKLWSHVSKFLNRSPEESFDIPFIQKSHTAAVHTAERAEPQGASSSSMESGPEQEGPVSGALPLKSSLTPSSQDEEEGPDSSHGPLPDSGATSEEECTNSYLTLCNEYEQEKMEPDSLEERPLLSAGQGPSSTTEDPPSPRSHSLLSNDSLCSPITAQELRFFTEEDPGEVFSPTRLSVDSLDQSKKTPMEFFRIDSKDSASEVLCPEPADKPKFDPSKAFYPAPEPEPATKGHKVDLWGLDSDRASNESVPVISFKEALVEDAGSCDEGRPPDLLVNLPGVADALSEELVSTGPSSAGEANASPKFGKPDVLQLHHAVEDLAAPALSPEDAGLPTAFADPLNDDLLDTLDPSLGDCRDLTLGLEATELDAHAEFPQELPGVPASLTLTSTSGSDALFADSEETPARPGHRLSAAAESVLRLIPDAEGAELKTDSLSVEESKPDKDISQLFRDLDERLLMAAQAHIPEEYVRRWAVEIIVALDALHQQGIVCRDLNPSNILLNDRGHIQLTYFCSWGEVEDQCDREAITHMYCAPEVGSICEETAACDWWSLGAILFELLTGKSLCRCHPAGISRHTSLNVPDFVSEEARSLLQQLLQFNPIERLGAGVVGVEDIKSHPFFARVVWPK